ncbi:hypothetical protein EDB19DRAFT_1827950 [Suillus lakei]|nr:hypothetical protein EDB19DRAFT_1827950 [Suillus lakei]
MSRLERKPVGHMPLSTIYTHIAMNDFNGCTNQEKLNTIVNHIVRRDGPGLYHGHFDWAKSFPAPWSKKHSNKGISPLLLIRLGLASAKSGRVFKGGRFNIDRSILTQDELAEFHQRILNILSDRQFGPYRVAELLFGSAKARSIGLSSNTYTVNPGLASTSLGKRTADDADDEVEIFEMSAQHMKRSRFHRTYRGPTTRS